MHFHACSCISEEKYGLPGVKLAESLSDNEDTGQVNLVDDRLKDP